MLSGTPRIVGDSLLAGGIITGALTITDDKLLGLGTDADGVLVNRSTSLTANTALTGVLIGTPVTPVAIAANSLLVGNVTASGDILLAVNKGGTSHMAFMADGSTGDTLIQASTGQSVDTYIAGTKEIDYATGAMAFQQATTISTTATTLTLNPATTLVFSKSVSSYNTIATEGDGLLAIRKKPTILTGQTAAVSSVGAITAPNDAANHEYLVSGFLNVTAFTSGTLNLQVAYTDHAAGAQTKTITLANDAGTAVTGATGGGFYQGLAIYISADPNTTITVKTAGTFVATYDVGAAIVQVV